MKTIDKRQDKSEDLGPAAVVGTSTLKPREGGGKVVPPKEPTQRSGPPLAFETPSNPELTTDVTVGTTNLLPSPLPLEQPPFSPIEAWCGACGSGLWQDVKTGRVACLYKKECPIALKNEEPIQLTQEQAFEQLLLDKLAVKLPEPLLRVADEIAAISERMDVDRSVVAQMHAEHESPRCNVNQVDPTSHELGCKRAIAELELKTRAVLDRETLDRKEVEERKLNGLVCRECGLEQFVTSASPTCDNGHGGVEGIRPALYHHLPSEGVSEPGPVPQHEQSEWTHEILEFKPIELPPGFNPFAGMFSYGPQAPTAPPADCSPLVISSSSGIRIEIPVSLTKEPYFVELLRALRVLLGAE